jgi:hypothetical protein
VYDSLVHAPPPLLVVLAALLAFGCSDQNFKELDVQDTFVQGADHIPSDVLFVIDDSASMAEEQARLARSFDAFVAALPESRADYQLGVVTTSTDVPDESGVLVGGVISAAQDDVLEAFRAAVQVGTQGAREERGLQAALLAVAPSRNPGFLRDDTQLQVVVLSDEDDQSVPAVSEVLVGLASAAGAEGLVVHAIVGDEPVGCNSGTSAASAGSRYLEAVRSTMGFRESLCAEDYTDVLVRIALELASQDDTFYLTRLPVPESLEVRVDDVLIPQREVDGWTYAAGDNAVVFHGFAIPPDGTTITVGYLPWAGAAD